MAKEKTPRRPFKLPFKLPIFGSSEGEKNVPQDEKRPPVLKLIFFIADWNKANVISQVFDEENVRFHFITKGLGTANSDILDLLGIGAGDKAVVLCIEQAVLVPVLLREVRKALNSRGPGAGIAFTVPLSGINTPLIRVFKESINQNQKIAAEEGGKPMAAEKNTQPEPPAGTFTKPDAVNNDLIVSVVNQGYSDEFMTVAREAGASGGTVINARGLVHGGPVKFFGVSVQDEKEIIIILTSREKKVAIMQAASQACGITSKAEGIIFSLPVDTVLGMSFD
jgi:hypothetical protein